MHINALHMAICIWHLAGPRALRAGGGGQDGGAEQGEAAAIVVHEPSVTGQARKVDFIIPIHGSV